MAQLLAQTAYQPIKQLLPRPNLKVVYRFEDTIACLVRRAFPYGCAADWADDAVCDFRASEGGLTAVN